MITGSIKAQKLSTSALRRSLRLALGLSSTSSLRRVINHQATTSAAAIIRPGAIPARNSLVIDSPEATPSTTKPMLGGMIEPSTDTEAISPPERLRL